MSGMGISACSGEVIVRARKQDGKRMYTTEGRSKRKAEGERSEMGMSVESSQGKRPSYMSKDTSQENSARKSETLGDRVTDSEPEEDSGETLFLNGSQDAQIHLGTFIRMMQYPGPSADADLCLQFPFGLDGQARKWYNRLSHIIRRDWGKLILAFLTKFVADVDRRVS
ncbi:hypothetical protein M5689_019000 [Euphorbia peplus]|nr:hypothetical protein M5689_019000 [Euphorbia peplus]